MAEIPAATGLLSFVEIEKDTFYVVAGNISVTLLIHTAGNFSVWRVDVKTFKLNNSLARVERVEDIPHAKFLNGATVLSCKDGTLLITDSLLGSVFRVNTRSKEVRLITKDPLFDLTSATAVAAGISGLKFDRSGEIYFTPTKIFISPDGTPKAKGQVLSSGIEFADDFIPPRRA